MPSRSLELRPIWRNRRRFCVRATGVIRVSLRTPFLTAFELPGRALYGRLSLIFSGTAQHVGRPHTHRVNHLSAGASRGSP